MTNGDFLRGLQSFDMGKGGTALPIRPGQPFAVGEGRRHSRPPFPDRAGCSRQAGAGRARPHSRRGGGFASIVADIRASCRGVFHMTGQGEATWADVAEATSAAAERHGRRPVRVRRIGTLDYPTPAMRPANSRLDNDKLSRTYGVVLPEWRRSLSNCVDRLLSMT